MTLGILTTSIASGNLISRYGRYRVFPIIGTATMTVALALLSRLEVATPIWVTCLDLLVLGLGLGFVMQVLVLAAQNSVPHRMLGTVTSVSTMSRQVGGTIGVSVFGAIFSNRLGHELADRMPPGVHLPSGVTPTAVRGLPPEIHDLYVAAFAAALHPVFLAAAGVSVLAFGLSWLLDDVPLRTTVAAEIPRTPAPAS
jgi:MFS family permease